MGRAVAEPVEIRTIQTRDCARPGLHERLTARLLWLMAIASCIWVLIYIVLRAVQLYPLDAFEEYEFWKAVRWSHGVPIHVAAGDELLPTAYPPLYYWVLGTWLRCWGESLVAARCLSLTALAAIVACGCWALRDTADRRVARLVFLAALLAFHALVRKWFELCKADTLLTLFLAMAIVTGEHASWRQVLVGSIALVFAALTKQNAPIFVPALALAHAMAGRWRWALGWGAAVLALIAGTYAALDGVSAGELHRWVFTWTAGHGMDPIAGGTRLLRAIVTRAPILIAILIGSLAIRPRSRETACLLAALALAAVGMSKYGGLENHLLPAAFVAAVLLGRAAAWLWRLAPGLGALRVLPHGFARAAALALLALTLWPGLPRPRDFRWVASRACEVEQWVAAVQQLPGSVAVGHHYVLARRAGAACFFSDLIFEFPGLVVPPELRGQIEREVFPYLLLENDPGRCPTPGWCELIAAHYAPVGELEYPDRSGLLPRRLYAARGARFLHGAAAIRDDPVDAGSLSDGRFSSSASR